MIIMRYFKGNLLINLEEPLRTLKNLEEPLRTLKNLEEPLGDFLEI
jgi:hypothetical protein